LPVDEMKNVLRERPSLAVDAASQAARVSQTSRVIGSRRLRLPLDHITSTCRPGRSTCSANRPRASQVLTPHECISVKNATACHRHGDVVTSRPAAAKNASTSRLLSR